MPRKKRSETDEAETVKKPFDKARWREKKYSKKFKVDQWEERRRKAVVQQYYKDLRKEDPTAEHPGKRKKAAENTEASRAKPNAYQQAQDAFQRQKEEKEKRKQEIETQNMERKAALNQYRLKKAEKFKKLSKKTKKGQPVMKDRMEMLLEKIKSDVQYK